MCEITIKKLDFFYESSHPVTTQHNTTVDLFVYYLNYTFMRMRMRIRVFLYLKSSMNFWFMLNIT